MSEDERLDAAVAALGAARTLEEARRAIDAWAPRFHDALSGPIVAGPRPELNLELTRLPSAGGLTARKGSSFFVGVGTKGGRKGRFTFAHELAHVLLHTSGELRVTLTHADEEELCDRFARRALAPPRLVREDLAIHGVPTELDEIEAFAARFRISLRASLVALDEFFPAEWPVAFVAAGWRGHPCRREVRGLRVDAAATDRRFFFPVHCRLSTLGYERLERWVLEAVSGERGDGRDDGVRVRSARAGVSGWTGQSAWSAQRHFAPGSRAEADLQGVLCRVDLSRLSPLPPRSRRRRPQLSIRASPAKITGQLRLPEAADLRSRPLL